MLVLSRILHSYRHVLIIPPGPLAVNQRCSPRQRVWECQAQPALARHSGRSSFIPQIQR